MQKTAVCPYYGCDEDTCDVGCGYITSHDANMIIKFCSSKYQACQKYKQLTDRYDAPITTHQPRAPKSAPVHTGPESQVPVFGLACFSLTTLLFSLDQFPFMTINTQFLGIVLLIGAFGQILTGLGSLKQNPLRAVAFTGFGLFWLSMLALDVLPRAGYGHDPGQLPMVGYLAMWGLFSLILCQGLDSLARICRMAFTLLTLFLLLLAVSYATESIAALHAAALIGVISSFPGVYMGLRHLYLEVERTLYPDLSGSESARRVH